MLVRKATGRVDGFVIEGPTAGGHNAPPRGRLEIDAQGEPIYGERDNADLAEMRKIGLPFWLAGGTGTPEQVNAALAAGAAGVQVGTLFALCEDSGIAPELREGVLHKLQRGEAEVRTDVRASPTGFPFKVVQLEGTNSEQDLYERRERICDLGYLREAYRREDGRLDYRCAAEPVDTYVKKGGKVEDTVGRKCLCNGLMANIGHAQIRDDRTERAVLTSGSDLDTVERILARVGRMSYSANDALDFLLSKLPERSRIRLPFRSSKRDLVQV
jgi:NAD(P)H-dependent flavin oxidoreductase YrpB (nitropropane dioxygenase family)